MTLGQVIREGVPTGLQRTGRAELFGESRRASAGGGLWAGFQGTKRMETQAEAGGVLCRPLAVRW